MSNPSINPAATSATMTLSTSSGASGRFTLVGTNPAGSSDPTPFLGFLPSATMFNTISIPGSDPNADPDGDGLTNAKEIAAGTVLSTAIPMAMVGRMAWRFSTNPILSIL